MSDKKEPTAAEVVAEINQEVWDALLENDKKLQNEAPLFTLGYSTDGFSEGVVFLGENLWDDLDNGIPWDDAQDAPARSLKEHLLLRMRQMILTLQPLANFCEVASTASTSSTNPLVPNRQDAVEPRLPEPDDVRVSRNPTQSLGPDLGETMSGVARERGAGSEPDQRLGRQTRCELP